MELVKVRFTISAVCITWIVLIIVYIVCCIGLIVGAAKCRRWLLVPWMVLTILILILI